MKKKIYIKDISLLITSEMQENLNPYNNNHVVFFTTLTLINTPQKLFFNLYIKYTYTAL
jgi:hypothetical protein